MTKKKEAKTGKSDEKAHQKKKPGKHCERLHAFFRWAPRILGILLALLLELFAFDTGSFVGFLMHSIPSAVIIISVLIGWRHPNVGGIVFVLLGVVTVFFYHTYRDPWLLAIISGPFFLIGAMHLDDHRMAVRHKSEK
ncbi:MAG: hypothetical protein ABIC95_07310 [archaeon]